VKARLPAATRSTPLPTASRRGMATLTVVMVLFFILAMVAAYSNRTMLVEQRGASNTLRAAQAFEATDAGVEWALTQLNGPRLTSTCASSAALGDADFRSLYLTRVGDGTYTVNTYGAANLYLPSCVANQGTWTCSCPSGAGAGASPSLALPPNGLGQAFRVNFVSPVSLNLNPATSVGPGLVQVLVQGCSNLGSGATSCIAPFSATPPQVDAYNRAQVWLGLVRALPSRPRAALTAGTTVTVGPAATLTVTNGDDSTGLSVHVGNPIGAGGGPLQLAGPAGSPGNGRADNDAALLAVAGSRSTFFASIFGMDMDNYRRQPATVVVPCGVGGCTSADLADPLARYPGRVLWVDGDLNLDAAGTIGSASQPAMIVVTGNVPRTLTLSAAVTYNGFLYADAVSWAAGADNAVVHGAMVSATTFGAAVNATVAYDASILGTISNYYGSFVRVPGGTAQF
jgi:hypothetical protein